MDDLLEYFNGRCLPETAFQITTQASTSNLKKCVKLAITLAKDGHKPSLITLSRIKSLLEKQAMPSSRTY